MHVIVLKLIFISVMLMISLAVGLLPLFIYRRLMDPTRVKLGTGASIIVSMLSCFSGGVILCVSWLDILPDALEFYEQAEEKSGGNLLVLFVEIFMAIGFFLLYLIEELIGEFFARQGEQRDRNKAANSLTESKRSSSMTQYDTVSLTVVTRISQEQRKPMANVYTFILAITFHMFMEGFLFGAQTKARSMSSLFFGIIVHKMLVLFSIGIKLARQLDNRQTLAIFFIILLSFSSPLSSVVGLLAQSLFNDNLSGAIFSTVISSLSVGTFTYIALFEIIVPERNAPYSKLLQWVSCFAGFALMAGVLIVA